MDAKRREEIHKELDWEKDVSWNAEHKEGIDKAIDLTEKAVREEMVEASLLVEPMIRFDANVKFKSAVEKALPCLIERTCAGYKEQCDNCRKRREIFKEVGIEG
jgi:hypothetical protein